MTATLKALGWLDWTLLAVLGVSVVVGIVRGFVFELLSLAGWIVAWFAAQWAAPELAPRLPVGAPGSVLNLALSFALCFLAALLLWTMLAKLVRWLVHATPLSVVDRAMGAGFGLLRGAIVLLALATLVALTPAAKSPEWRGSHGATWLMIALQGLKPLLPPAMSDRLPA